jgi:uncharacterized protein
VNRALLDVNVLIALSWPEHVSHGVALRWFSRNAHRGWATCPITQTGFVRILSNPGFSQNALTPQQALAILENNIAHPDHRFWPDDLSPVQALSPTKGITGHRQITDAYLLTLAAHHRGTVATLDRALRDLAKAMAITVEVID